MQIDKEEIQEIIDNKIKEGVKKYGKDFKYFILEILGLEKMLQPEAVPEKKERLIPLIKWNEYHPEPSVKALRMLVFRAEENGFNAVIVRRGNRVLLNENEYFKWIKQRAV